MSFILPLFIPIMSAVLGKNLCNGSDFAGEGMGRKSAGASAGQEVQYRE